MKYTFRQKIHTLRKILKDYANHMIRFDSAVCYARGKYIVITFYRKGQGFYDLKRRIPKREIDKVTARYRAKLHNEIKKKTPKKELIRCIPVNVLNIKFF